MSWPVTLYYCTKCDFAIGDVVTWGMKEYLLPNKVHIPVNRHLGWCDDCGRIASVEQFPLKNAKKPSPRKSRPLQIIRKSDRSTDGGNCIALSLVSTGKIVRMIGSAINLICYAS